MKIPSASRRSWCASLSVLLFCPLFFLLLIATSSPCGAEDGDPLVHSSYGRELMLRGEFEQGLEHLRRAYLLFPLNENLKRNLAEGYAAYGNMLLKRKQYEQADQQFVRAIEIYPDEAAYALLRGICTYYLKRYDTARYELQRARERSAQSPEILYYQGLVAYESADRPQAIQLWEQALKITPERKEIVEILARARREAAVEGGMGQGHSSRFDLTYDQGVETAFALSLLDVLESAANLVGSELGHFPEARIPVAIYTRDDFRTVTESPDWSGGVYDGKIRLPFGRVNEITPAMRGVLYHEYAHAVVFDITRGNCPLWLNEGIAEMFGRMQHNRPLPDLGKALRSGKTVPLRSLESGFTGMASSQASLAYQQSYAVVNYLVVTYGWHRVRQIMTGLGKGMGIDEAIAAAFRDFGVTYDSMAGDWLFAMKRGIGAAP